MHDMPPEHIHEEIELQELDFGTYLLEWLARRRAGATTTSGSICARRTRT